MEKSELANSPYILDGAYRCVKNYPFSYKTHTKERWLNKKIIDVFTGEYKAFTKEYYTNAIETGKITVNKKKVPLDYILKNSDLIEHETIRRELPVYNAPIEIIYEDKRMLVIDKPPSIPVHACGAYNENSILQILRYENGYKNLHTLHRLDRPTSGI